MSLIIPAALQILDTLLVVMGLWFLTSLVPPEYGVALVVAYMALIVMVETSVDDYEEDS